jgi:hypothetical protein
MHWQGEWEKLIINFWGIRKKIVMLDLTGFREWTIWNKALFLNFALFSRNVWNANGIT